MTSTSTPSDASPTLSTETIAGIVIGVVGGVAVVAAACFYLRCWRKSKGKFTKLRKRGRAVDPEEEFVSGGSSFGVHGRYGHGQQLSVSLEPLLPSSTPQTSQDSIPAVSAPQIPLDWSYLPPVLPNIPTDPNYFSLYDTDDPFARIQRAILPTSPVHPIPASSRRVSHEVPLEQYTKYTAKNPGPNTPLFINRTLARHSGPDFFSGRESTPSFPSADPPQFTSSQTGSDTVHLFADAPPTPPKPRISILSPLAEHTTPREEAHLIRISGSEVDAHSPESIYSQESAQHSSHPPEPQLPSQSSRRGRVSQRYSRSFKLSELSTVMEGSTSTSGPSSRDVSTNPEMQKKPSLTFSELERSSSVSVALSHTAPSTAPELTSFPLLSSNDAFRKSGYSSSTISPRAAERRGILHWHLLSPHRPWPARILKLIQRRSGTVHQQALKRSKRWISQIHTHQRWRSLKYIRYLPFIDIYLQLAGKRHAKLDCVHIRRAPSQKLSIDRLYNVVLQVSM
ncbi:uncharacterized protein F5891DRAFT_981395 [Suillus fuscotomentosus]|uniref:Uncharacterized protein n=1 Tax=Suillus fuscotomentosus TaxID=1912939 RepID=A0AAD4E3D7_9AGAM|nr:uncharacterized protein F5891DRAFT_981395 [Suillus fuscotomentosus]KAG1898975.1 hypothetical protein F5891DRAFT_981395 [Suillus fuscotomentosus]